MRPSMKLIAVSIVKNEADAEAIKRAEAARMIGTCCLVEIDWIGRAG